MKNRKQKMTGTVLVRVRLTFSEREMFGEECADEVLASLIQDLPITMGDDIALELVEVVAKPKHKAAA